MKAINGCAAWAVLLLFLAIVVSWFASTLSVGVVVLGLLILFGVALTRALSTPSYYPPDDEPSEPDPFPNPDKF